MDPLLVIYREMFVKMINSDSTEIIDNSSRDHAKIIIQELVKHASCSIYMQCSNLAACVYEDKETIEIFKDAIDRGVKVTIAVRESDNKIDARDFYEFIEQKQKSNNNVTIMKQKSVYKSDFCVTDSKRFRLEKDNEQATAYVCANCKEIASLLESVFQNVAA